MSFSIDINKLTRIYKQILYHQKYYKRMQCITIINIYNIHSITDIHIIKIYIILDISKEKLHLE